jgi:hypothetical protein
MDRTAGATRINTPVLHDPLPLPHAELRLGHDKHDLNNEMIIGLQA